MIFLAVLPFLTILYELLNPGKRFKKKIWTISLWCFALFLAYSYGSRCVGCAVYDDYNNVYKFQGQYLSDIGFNGFFENSIAVTNEYFFYIIFWFVANIFQPDYWLFGLSLITISFLIFSFRGYINDHLIIVLIGLSSLGLSTQLVRQYMAWSILLFVFLQLNKNRAKWLIYLSTTFVHFSSIVLLIKLISSKIKAIKILLLTAILFSILFYFQDFFFSLNFEQIKFLTSVSLESDILDYNKLFINRVLILSFLFFLWPKIRPFILISIMIFIMTYYLPLVPVRLNLIILSHTYGLLCIYFLLNLKKSYQLLGTLAIYTLVIFRLIFYTTDINNDFRLWESYNMIF